MATAGGPNGDEGFSGGGSGATTVAEAFSKGPQEHLGVSPSLFFEVVFGYIYGFCLVFLLDLVLVLFSI